ncbi:hypothetical protein P9239_01490 [Caballeronia sp. LZ062]|uniref:hypothetical protein n=1 Tax=unclassified Caballeronia TaxID=2646786 RepID=UPI00286684EB|nr:MULTISPECIES: hypothetical protein [unclassified Caballeronia]MDR5857481.1 hypothetical protein [Caballeronia sp. LZ050]MDR5869031.1 hypothetical protein [Caballeronia sp. LZ062]
MRPTFGTVARVAAVLAGTTFALAASAQDPTARPEGHPNGQQNTQPNSPKPSRLDKDSTPAYHESNVTPPAVAATQASSALRTEPGKTSSGKGPAPKRPNGLGFDSDAGSMGKKP